MKDNNNPPEEQASDPYELAEFKIEPFQPLMIHPQFKPGITPGPASLLFFSLGTEIDSFAVENYSIDPSVRISDEARFKLKALFEAKLKKAE